MLRYTVLYSHSMPEFRYRKHILKFIRPAGTSRGVLYEKPSYFLEAFDGKELVGVGECSTIVDLSIDHRDDYEEQLEKVVEALNSGKQEDSIVDGEKWPSIQFGIETLFKSLESPDPFRLFETSFLQGNGIAINGLVWMGAFDQMLEEAQSKGGLGFECLKFKIGAIDFEKEVEMIARCREAFPNLHIRLDANGAFSKKDVFEKLDRLAVFKIHSLEQPVKPKQWDLMKELCAGSPIPIALDEELIGVYKREEKEELMQALNPSILILKPSLLGGFKSCDEWIELANEHQAKWWATSALESNVGLNAIAQWVSQYENEEAQGLGTGQLYLNNINSPLSIRNGYLYYLGNERWNYFKS